MNTQVNHEVFGKGIVISNDGDFITVNFNGIEKMLMKMYANLKNEDGSPFEGRETNEERAENSFIKEMTHQYEQKTILKMFL